MLIDSEERKLVLSTRQLTPDPWDDIEKRYPVESKHTGRSPTLSTLEFSLSLTKELMVLSTSQT